MPDRTDQLIDTNHMLLAEAAAARQRTQQIVTRAVASRIKRDEVRRRWRWPLLVLSADDHRQPEVPHDLP
jgi:hypothetical protein